MEAVSNFWPAIAVPITVKMPEPMTAPMPSPVSDHGPSDFFSRCSGCSESEISLSMDLHAKICFARVWLPGVWNWPSEFKQNGEIRASLPATYSTEARSDNSFHHRAGMRS